MQSGAALAEAMAVWPHSGTVSFHDEWYDASYNWTIVNRYLDGAFTIQEASLCNPSGFGALFLALLVRYLLKAGTHWNC